MDYFENLALFLQAKYTTGFVLRSFKKGSKCESFFKIRQEQFRN